MWEKVKLGDVCRIVNGGTPNSKVPAYWSGDIDWLTPKDMGKLPSRYISNTERAITQDGLENSSAKLIPSGSVLLSCRAPIGHTGINPKPISFNQGCKGLIPDNEVIAEYLCYFLFASKKLLNDLGSGTTFKEISSKTLSQVPIPLPPLAEQKRIVERLDKAFGEIDKAIATAEAKEREAKCLVSEAIKQVFRQSPENKKEKFSEVCVLQRGFDLPKKDRSSGMHPLYSANGITDYISVSKVPGPAVITGRSGTIGEVHYSEKDIWPLNTALYVKDFKGNLPKYVYYFLRSFNLKKYASGTGVPTLNRNVLEHELVYVCEGSDHQEQKCRILDKIEEEAFKIIRIQKQQLALLRQLKVSILKRELTPSEAV